eukprot:UN07505
MKFALALDTNNIHASTVPIILYCTRLTTYVCHYITWLLDYFANQCIYYRFGSLPDLIITDDALAILKKGREVILLNLLRKTTMSKLITWNKQLFNEIYHNLTEDRYQHHIVQNEI